jgi:hypothetical protein
LPTALLQAGGGCVRRHRYNPTRGFAQVLLKSTPDIA